MSKFTKLLPAAALIIAAIGLLSSSCIVEDDGTAKVRFTWERNQMPFIQSIAASYDDVQKWYNYVYMAADYIEEDASEVPKYNGSQYIPDNIYSSALPQSAERYKGFYHTILAGKYTAVCTVDDIVFNRTYDIVANYQIDVSGSGTIRYFEVAFDVKRYLNGNSDKGWIWEDYGSDPNTNDPLLQKAPAKRLVKKIEGDGVTFYVLSRPRNAIPSEQ